MRQVFRSDRVREPSDADASLYDSSSATATSVCSRRSARHPPGAGPREFGFRDARLPELLFRYRARNWPQTLSNDERDRWNAYRRQRLCTESGFSEYSFERFHAEIAALRTTHANDAAKLALLDRLQGWGREMGNELMEPVS